MHWEQRPEAACPTCGSAEKKKVEDWHGKAGYIDYCLVFREARLNPELLTTEHFHALQAQLETARRILATEPGWVDWVRSKMHPAFYGTFQHMPIERQSAHVRLGLFAFYRQQRDILFHKDFLLQVKLIDLDVLANASEQPAVDLDDLMWMRRQCELEALFRRR